LRFGLTERIATSAAQVVTVAAKASQTEAVHGVAVLIAVAAALVERLPAAVVVKAAIKSGGSNKICGRVPVATGLAPLVAAFAEAPAVAGVGTFAAGVFLAVVDRKATSAFPNKSIQKRLLSVRGRRARPSIFVWFVIGRVWAIASGLAGTY
jgi:hypothetical protein